MTFLYKLDLYPVKISRQTKSELSVVRLSKMIIIYINTYRQMPPFCG